MIDASAALYAALSRRSTAGMEGFVLTAPPILRSEAVSALSAAVNRGALPSDSLDAAFDRLEALPVEIIDDGRTHRRTALDLARSLGWAKTYDAEYVVLAQRLGCELLTTDERLERGVRHLVTVRRPTELFGA